MAAATIQADDSIILPEETDSGLACEICGCVDELLDNNVWALVTARTSVLVYRPSSPLEGGQPVQKGKNCSGCSRDLSHKPPASYIRCRPVNKTIRAVYTPTAAAAKLEDEVVGCVREPAQHQVGDFIAQGVDMSVWPTWEQVSREFASVADMREAVEVVGSILAKGMGPKHNLIIRQAAEDSLRQRIQSNGAGVADALVKWLCSDEGEIDYVLALARRMFFGPVCAEGKGYSGHGSWPKSDCENSPYATYLKKWDPRGFAVVPVEHAGKIFLCTAFARGMIGVSGCVECTRGLATVYYGALINDYADFFDMGKLASDMWEMCTEVKKHYDRSTASTCQDTLSAGFDCLRTCLLNRVCYESGSPHPKGNLSTQLMWRVVESGYMASASGRCASADIPRVAVMALALLGCMTHDAIDFWSDLTYGEHNNIFCYLYHSSGEAAVSAGVWWASTVLAGLRATYPDIVGYVGASVWWQFYNVRYSAPRQMQYVADRCVGVRVNESSYETILSLDTMLIPLLQPEV
ncbi:hypothetical protein F5H01DRAFT_373499 [Linnemannia elongata]|nr:hypothetical protein F5H01DRAFT_373499 [Linnemannia elongata]